MGKSLELEIERPLSPLEFEVGLLTPEKLLHYWRNIEVELDRVPHIWATYWTKDSLREGALTGRFQVWEVGTKDSVRLIVFSQFISYPACNLLSVFLALGNSLDQCLPVLEAMLEKMAHDNNCQIGQVVGRPGWERKLKGFKRTAVVLTKEVPKFGVQ